MIEITRDEKFHMLKAMWEASGRRDWDDLYYVDYPYTKDEHDRIMDNLHGGLEKIVMLMAEKGVDVVFVDH